MISGLGGQLNSWDEGFLDHLSDAGFGLLRFDNRDCGLSQSFDDHGPASLSFGPEDLEAPETFTVEEESAPYTLVDMADDTAGLLWALGVGAAHVMGVSMGGMIAQQLVISHPELVLSLCSIMSTTGARDVGLPSPAALQVLLDKPPRTRAEYIDNEVRIWKVISSPGFPFDEERIRRKAARAFDRSFRPDGVGRQLMAIVASPDRTEALHDVGVPTVVIHGDGDPLVDPSGGVATATAVPGSRFLAIPGMGHDLPPEVWDEVTGAIAENAARADGSPGADR